MNILRCMHGNGPECKRCAALDIPDVEEMEATITALRVEKRRLQDERDAARAQGARLRAGLEELISVVTGIQEYAGDEPHCAVCNGWAERGHKDGCGVTTAIALLAETPAQAVARVKAEALREVANETQVFDAVQRDWLRSEAARMEGGANE